MLISMLVFEMYCNYYYSFINFFSDQLAWIFMRHTLVSPLLAILNVLMRYVILHDTTIFMVPYT